MERSKDYISINIEQSPLSWPCPSAACHDGKTTALDRLSEQAYVEMIRTADITI